MKGLLIILTSIVLTLLLTLMVSLYINKSVKKDIGVYHPTYNTEDQKTPELVKVSDKTYIPQKPIVIFYVPHEDDETLSMGVGIRNYIRDGYDVKVVLLTRGEGSGAIETLNSKPYNLHLTKEEFSNARIEEARRALLALGVSMTNIDIRNLGDGNVTVDEVIDLIKEYKANYPSALHNSMSYKDSHPDHANSGKALLKLYNDGIIKDVKFYINIIQFDKIKGTYEKYDSNLDYAPIHEALDSYKIWNPSHKDYAIGYHSVQSTFDTVTANPRSKYHLANQ